MEQSIPPKRKQTVPIVLFMLFLTAEIAFAKASGDDIYFLVRKTIFLSILLFLAYRKLKWAIWPAGILMILQGLVCIIGAWEEEMFTLLFLSLFYIAFGFYIIKSRPRATAHSTIVTDEANPETPEATAPLEPAPQQPTHSQGFVVQEQQYIYPLLIKRYQAIFADTLILFAVLITIMMLTDGLEDGTDIRVTLSLFILLTYEPLLTVYGTTVGQKIAGIRVRKMENPAERISLFNAYLRIVTKFSFGIISFLTINTNPEHRAIHDFISGSVMIREKKS